MRKSKGKSANIIVLFSIILIIIGTLMVLALVSGGILKMLGFEYRSLGAFVLFFAIYFLVSILGDFFSGILSSFFSAAFMLSGLTNEPSKWIHFFFDTIVNCVVLSFIDYEMKSIRIPTMGIMIFAAICSGVDTFLLKDELMEEA